VPLFLPGGRGSPARAVTICLDSEGLRRLTVVRLRVRGPPAGPGAPLARDTVTELVTRTSPWPPRLQGVTVQARRVGPGPPAYIRVCITAWPQRPNWHLRKCAGRHVLVEPEVPQGCAPPLAGGAVRADSESPAAGRSAREPESCNCAAATVPRPGPGPGPACTVGVTPSLAAELPPAYVPTVTRPWKLQARGQAQAAGRGAACQSRWAWPVAARIE
jgi:hypothetical protein